MRNRLIGLCLLLAGCAAAPALPPAAPPSPTSPPTATPSPAPTGPDYAAMFSTDRVPALTVTIAPADWERMLVEMKRLFGARGLGRIDNQAQARFGDGQKPLWVPADVTWDGQKLPHAGVRFKGWGSLREAWKRGTDRFPMKLDLDQFEDDFPETRNRRLHGFKQLMLMPGTQDPSSMREVLAGEAFAEAGVPVASAGFCKVALERGDGARSLGVYTVLEGVDDTAVTRLFKGKEGSLYEAEGDVATFAAGARDALKKGFVLEGGPDVGLADVEALYDALHDPARTTAPAAWRERLEARFDVDGFLAWLAIAAVIEHFDTYGNLAHNFYLYDDPLAGNRLRWVTWDHNWIMGLVVEGGQTSSAKAGPLDQRDVTARYPLIRFLMDDPVYRARYFAHVRKALTGGLSAARFTARVKQLADVLRPAFADEPGGGAALDQAAGELASYMAQRVADAEKSLTAVK